MQRYVKAPLEVQQLQLEIVISEDTERETQRQVLKVITSMEVLAVAACSGSAVPANSCSTVGCMAVSGLAAAPTEGISWSRMLQEQLLSGVRCSRYMHSYSRSCSEQQ